MLCQNPECYKTKCEGTFAFLNDCPAVLQYECPRCGWSWTILCPVARYWLGYRIFKGDGESRAELDDGEDENV